MLPARIVQSDDLFLARDAASRRGLEQFIARRFLESHGAHVEHFCERIVGLPGPGGWQAAAGYTPAIAGRLFLEHYLEQPVERVLAAAAGAPVRRDEVVEIGNLATARPGAARGLVCALARHLRGLGYEWAVFTATRTLRNALRRLRLQALTLAIADAERLPGGGARWGTYYRHDPAVLAGRIPPGPPVLA